MRLVAFVTALFIVAFAAASLARAEMTISPCPSSEYTAAIGRAPPVAGTPGSTGPKQLTLVLAGDTGTNPKGAPVSPTGFT